MKTFTLVFVLSVCFFAAASQKFVDERTTWSVRDRGYIGLGFGGLGLGSHSVFGNYFSIGVTPMAGYMLTKNLSSGLAFEYQYTSYSDLDLRIHTYAWYPFVRYNIKNFFLQADYDWYNLDDFTSPERRRITLERFFTGVGYSSTTGGRSAVNFLVSYDLLYTNTSRFSSPISIRVFVTF